MNDKNPADLLRRAATAMRQRAGAATPGRWESLDGGDRLGAWKLDPTGQFDDDFDYVVDEPMSNAANAEHIAYLDPAVASRIADLLDFCAATYNILAAVDEDPDDRGIHHYALAVALDYLRVEAVG
jgi:hypothetical protein